jgi:hypothetical protein
MSAVIAFCEQNDMSNMLHLLRHSGPVNHLQEVFALNVLEELAAGDAAKIETLRSIRNEIHPVERAARLRAQIFVQTEEIKHKKEVTIAALRKEIRELEAQVEKKRKELAKPQVEDETQDPEQTQLPNGEGSQDTQPEIMFDEQLRLLKQQKTTRDS